MTWRDEYIRSATPEDLYLKSKYSYGGEIDPGVAIDPIDLLGVPGAQSLINRVIKGLSQAAAKQAWARVIPQIGTALERMGNPITNTWKWLASEARQISDTLSDMPALALATQAEVKPTQIALRKALKAGWNDLLGHWNLTFPYYDPSGKYPVMVLSKTPSATSRFLENMGQPYSGSDFYGLTTIMYERPNRYLADLVTINPAPEPSKTIQHELGHVAKNRVGGYPAIIGRPEKYVQQARDIVASEYSPALPAELTKIAEQKPEYLENFWRRVLNNEFERWKEIHPAEAEFLFTNMDYKPKQIGEELWTRYGAKQPIPGSTVMASIMETSPISKGLYKVRDDLIHPELYRERPVIPLPMGILKDIGKAVLRSETLPFEKKRDLIDKILQYAREYNNTKSLGE